MDAHIPVWMSRYGFKRGWAEVEKPTRQAHISRGTKLLCLAVALQMCHKITDTIKSDWARELEWFPRSQWPYCFMDRYYRCNDVNALPESDKDVLNAQGIPYWYIIWYLLSICQYYVLILHLRHASCMNLTFMIPIIHGSYIYDTPHVWVLR